MRFDHTAYALCSCDEWLAFRGMVLAEQTKPGNANESLMLIVGREMNSDRILFGPLPFAVQFCGLHPELISHLSGLRVI